MFDDAFTFVRGEQYTQNPTIHTDIFIVCRLYAAMKSFCVSFILIMRLFDTY